MYVLSYGYIRSFMQFICSNVHDSPFQSVDAMFIEWCGYYYSSCMLNLIELATATNRF